MILESECAVPLIMCRASNNVQGLYCYSMVNVPLYDSLGPEARAFVISECEMRIIVAFDEVC